MEMSTKHTGIILGMIAGEIMPLEAYQTAVKGQNIAGFATVKDGELKVVRNGEPFTDEEFMEWQESLKDCNRLMFLGNYPEDYNEDDAQPLVMTRDGDTITSVVCIEGEYSNLHQPEESCADETQVLKRVINPLLSKYIDDNEEPSPEGFVKYATGTKTVHDAISEACKSRGVVVFMTGDGDINAISNNKLGHQFDWGSMSQTCGYTETVYPAKEEAPGMQMKAKGKKKMVVASEHAAPVAPAPETPPKKEDNKEGPVEATPINKPGDVCVPDKQGAVFTPPEGKVYVRPLKGLSKSDQKSLYHQACGFTPSKQSGDYGWFERPWVLSDMAKALQFKNKLEWKDESALAAALDKARSNKDTKPHELKAEQTLPVENKSSDVPIIPLSMQGDFNAKFLKSTEIEAILSGKKKPQTLAEIEKWESDHPDFVKKTGMTLEQLARAPYHKKVELCQQYHFLAALGLQTYGNALIKAEAKIVELETLLDKNTAPAVVTGEQAPAPKPKKKMMVAA
jgi:hypothetical protein